MIRTVKSQKLNDIRPKLRILKRTKNFKKSKVKPKQTPNQASVDEGGRDGPNNHVSTGIDQNVTVCVKKQWRRMDQIVDGDFIRVSNAIISNGYEILIRMPGITGPSTR